MKFNLRRIGIEETGSHLLISVSLQEQSFLLVLDTGASRTVIDYSFLKELLPDSDFEIQDEESVGVGASNLSSYVVRLDDFQIGELLIPEYDCACMDLSHVKQTYARFGFPEVHGVLGGDILERYQAIINYRTIELELNAER